MSISIAEQRNKLAADMRAMHAVAEEEERAFTPEEWDKFNGMEAERETLQKRSELADRIAGLRDDDVPPANAIPHEARSHEPEDRSEAPKDAYPAAFDAWLRRGAMDMSPEQRAVMAEYRAQGVGTGAAGGYTVPEGFGGRVIERMKDFGGIINVANVINTSSGNPIPYPTNDDSGNIGEILAENTQVSEQDTTFEQKILGAYKYSSKMIRVSVELLQDEEVNLESYLVNILGKRLGRAESQHFCTGDGTTQPEGITVGATIEATAAGAAAITFADMLDLEHSVDPAYRAGGVGMYLFNDQTLKLLKGLVDGEGRPLWLPAISDAAPATINGRRYQIDQGMPDVATAASSVCFGDFSAYFIRRVVGVDIMRLAERYADYHQVAFLGMTRVDAKLMDEGAVAKLTHP